MYQTNTAEFNLLEKLYRARLSAIPDADVFRLGLAPNKLYAGKIEIDRLKADGYLIEIPREKWIAVWITDLGFNNFKAYLDSIPLPVFVLPPEIVRFRELKQKLIGGTITVFEKAELSDLALKLISF